MPKRTTVILSTIGTQWRRVPKPGTLVELRFNRLTRWENPDDINRRLLDAVVEANQLGHRVTAIVEHDEAFPTGSTAGVTVSNITINGKLTQYGHSGYGKDFSAKHWQHIAVRDIYRTR